MTGVVVLDLQQFALVYLLLLVVLFIMKKCKINQTKLLIVASLRMTVQLVLAGLVLTYLFQNPHPLFTVAYLVIMTGFSIYMVLSKNQTINKKFQWIVGVSLGGAGLGIIAFFIVVVVRVDLFDPQYTIPIGGMIMGNAMKGVSLGLKTFNENTRAQRNKIDTLINMGVTPQKALMPFVNQAIETATLTTLISMLSMGIISLPGMMSGQMIAGTLPMMAILYQIAINIAVTTVTCIAVFCALYFGFRTLYNKRNQMIF